MRIESERLFRPTGPRQPIFAIIRLWRSQLLHFVKVQLLCRLMGGAILLERDGCVLNDCNGFCLRSVA